MFQMTFSGFVATDVEVGMNDKHEPWSRWRMALYRGKDKEATWVTVWCFGKTAEYADNQDVKKGDWIVVSADRPFVCEAWQDKSQKMGVNVSVWASRIDKQPAKNGG